MPLTMAQRFATRPSDTDAMTMTLAMTNVAGAMHASADRDDRSEAAAGIIVMPVDRRGHIDPQPHRAVIIEGPTPDSISASDMVEVTPFATSDFILDTLARANNAQQHFGSDCDWAIAGVWHAFALRSYGIQDMRHANGVRHVAQARVAFGGGHYATILWNRGGQRIAASGTVPLTGNLQTGDVLPRVVTGPVPFGGRQFARNVPEAQLDLFYREVEKMVPAATN